MLFWRQYEQSLHQRNRSDDDEDLALPPLPLGGKNYITPQGYARLRDELLDLIDNERPKVVEIVHWAASNGDRSENGDYLYGKKRLREIDRRIRFLTKRLEIAEVSRPCRPPRQRPGVFWRHRDLCRRQRRRADRHHPGHRRGRQRAGQVSWISPIARALLKARVGDEVKLVTPAGSGTSRCWRCDYPGAG